MPKINLPNQIITEETFNVEPRNEEPGLTGVGGLVICKHNSGLIVDLDRSATREKLLPLLLLLLLLCTEIANHKISQLNERWLRRSTPPSIHTDSVLSFFL